MNFDILQTVTIQSSNPILIVEADLESPGPKILYINDAFSKMTNYTLEDLKGKTPRVLQGKKSNRSIQKELKENLLNGDKFSFETVNYKKDGSEYHVKLNIFPIRNKNGDITHYASIQEDITKQKERIDYLQKFVDMQDNIVLISDGERIKFCNKRLFDFFGVNDLEEFNIHYGCISESFIEDDRFFNMSQVKDDENWVDKLRSLYHSKRVVTMLGGDFKIHAFSITVSEFDENNYILSFTNISQTVLNQVKLEEKTILDKLTGAYNREYFEKNYRSLIEKYESEGFKLAIALLDIDHFKSVNDTYGHDVGDYVLKKMVKVVNKFSRKEDILIRWGGEEFVMLLKIKEHGSLDKALEHIRRVIEIEKFETVGKITCSFGASIYNGLEDIEKTIKRADEAVYYSKRGGRNRVSIK